MSIRLTPKQTEAVAEILSDTEKAVTIDTVADSRNVTVDNGSTLYTVGARGKVTEVTE